MKPLNLRNTFSRIDAVAKTWSKSDNRLRSYYVISVVTTKNNENSASDWIRELSQLTLLTTNNDKLEAVVVANDM